MRSRIEDELHLDRQTTEASLVAGLFETMKICQDTLYRLYHERFDQPGSVAASDNNPINVADANQVSMGGGFDTEVSDFLSAVFQPIPTMPNADLLPNPNNVMGQSGQLQPIAEASSSNSAVPLDSGYGSDLMYECAGPSSTHADSSFNPNYSLGREMDLELGDNLDMYRQQIPDPYWET